MRQTSSLASIIHVLYSSLVGAGCYEQEVRHDLAEAEVENGSCSPSGLKKALQPEA